MAATRPKPQSMLGCDEDIPLHTPEPTLVPLDIARSPWIGMGLFFGTFVLLLLVTMVAHCVCISMRHRDQPAHVAESSRRDSTTSSCTTGTGSAWGNSDGYTNKGYT